MKLKIQLITLLGSLGLFLTGIPLGWAAPGDQLRLTQAEAAVAKARREYFNALKQNPGMSAADQESLRKRTVDPANENLNKIVSEIEKSAVDAYTKPADRNKPEDQFLFQEPKAPSEGEGDDEAPEGLKPPAPTASALPSTPPDKKNEPKITVGPKGKKAPEAVVIDGSNVPSEITFEKKPKKP
ncbi:hypothetical protein K2X30_00265 [bacterium]|nr:hypothetical protein [bacterium]